MESIVVTWTHGFSPRTQTSSHTNDPLALTSRPMRDNDRSCISIVVK